MRKNGIVVAIDGPAGAGKSTTARLVAQALGYLYLDTGAMYRAVGLAALRAGGDMEDADAMAALARGLCLNLKMADGCQWTILNGEDVSEVIRTGQVAQAASHVAKHQGVRDVLVARQQALGRDGGIVLEGRDTGSAIFRMRNSRCFWWRTHPNGPGGGRRSWPGGAKPWHWRP